MPRTEFVQEFPQHGKAIQRLDEAVRFAEKSFALAADRERFLAQSRERIAERIAEGRLSGPERETKDRGARTR